MPPSTDIKSSRRTFSSSGVQRRVKSASLEQLSKLTPNLFKGINVQPDSRKVSTQFWPTRKQSSSGKQPSQTQECMVCYITGDHLCFHEMLLCGHVLCNTCLVRYIYAIVVDRSTIKCECPCCDENMHPNDVKDVFSNWKASLLIEKVPFEMELNDTVIDQLVEKYCDYCTWAYLRKQPEMVWCPAVDCCWGVLVCSYSKCPAAHCLNPDCGTVFCTNCRTKWHENVTCEQNRREEASRLGKMIKKIGCALDVKQCPTCSNLITRDQDGSCNLMSCLVCRSRFCWLCLKITTELHYMPPGRCTFWGRELRSANRTTVYTCGMILTAPIFVGVIGVLAVPMLAIFLSTFCIGKIKHERYTPRKPFRTITLFAYKAAIMVTVPFVSISLVPIGMAASLLYIYVVIPIMGVKKTIRSLLQKRNSRPNKS